MFLIFKKADGWIPVRYCDIKIVEVTGRKVTKVTTEEHDFYSSRSVSKFCKRLPPAQGFFRINRQQLVNFMHVAMIRRNGEGDASVMFVMKDGSVAYPSLRAWREMRDELVV